MDNMLAQLNHMTEMDLSYKDCVCQSLATNPYRDALQAVFLDKKEVVRDHIDPALLNRSSTVQRTQQVLEERLEATALNLTAEEVKDVDISRLARKYEEDIFCLRQGLSEAIHNIDLNSQSAEKHIFDVLREQMRWRPIDQLDVNQAKASIQSRHEEAKNSARNEVTTQILLRRNKVTEHRKRRRNFGKEATEKLQKFFDDHKHHPYPTDEQKEQLAVECNISVQQVANWFGNRRIRSKKPVGRNNCEEDCYETQSESQPALNQETTTYGGLMNNMDYA